MSVSRNDEGKDAVMVIGTDGEVPTALLSDVRNLKHVDDVIYLEPY